MDDNLSDDSSQDKYRELDAIANFDFADKLGQDNKEKLNVVTITDNSEEKINGHFKEQPNADVTITSKSSLVSRIRKTPAQRNTDWKAVESNQFYTRIVPSDNCKVPSLAHGLDRVLFNPGVHYIKDPRTDHYNFTSYLEDITQPTDFDYDALLPYTCPSEDKSLIELARRNSKRYVGSTSSVSSALAQFYFTLSKFKPVDITCLSTVFANEATNYTRGCRAPASIYLRWKDGVYAIDVDKGFDVDDLDRDNDNDTDETVLSYLGRSMEKVLTLEPDLYARYLKASQLNIPDAEKNKPEAFAYGTDARLPRRVFDLKTRAVLPIRLDQGNYSDYTGYTLKRSHGLFESFEREYYDMIRAAFLKYSFQVRIGHMDGIMVTYHNTSKVFGFQYISREEMDARLFGSSKMGNEAFRYATLLFGKVLNAATAKYPQQHCKTLKLSFEARQTRMSPDVYMDIYAEPVRGTIDTDKKPADTFFRTKEMDTEHNEMSFFSLSTKSSVNTHRIDGPVELNHPDDHWQLKYRLHDAKLDLPEIQQRYKEMRKRQAIAYCTAGARIPFLKQFINE
ncbi:hypothetical protein DFQ29_007973 [Apophysomyces sp. BC1021]|nr:hypothetical protein DFQ29_007973 [Apophysomyces sp. BC1021]